MSGEIGQGVGKARAQSLDVDVLLDELDAAVAQVVGAAVLSSQVARDRWTARLAALREVRAEVERLRVRVLAGVVAARLKEEAADV